MSCGRSNTQPAVVSKEMAAGFFVLKEPKLQHKDESLEDSIRKNRVHMEQEILREYENNPLLANAELIDLKRYDFPGGNMRIDSSESRHP